MWQRQNIVCGNWKCNGTVVGNKGFYSKYLSCAQQARAERVFFLISIWQYSWKEHGIKENVVEDLK
uniref:Uncharacterized protein n=1 Tax=Tetraselmis sp. GSL018 TaxID=582737 RepID=A0A061SD77_9CHLO